MRVLLAVEHPDYAEILHRAVQDLAYTVTARVRQLRQLRAVARKTETDIMLLAFDEIDRIKLRHIERAYLVRPCPIVLFTRRGDTEIIDAALKAGVSAFIVDGLRAERIKPIIDTAVIRFNGVQDLLRELEQANTTEQERKLIGQATGILARQAHIPESAAAKALRRLALNRNKRTVDVADCIISGERLLAHV